LAHSTGPAPARPLDDTVRAAATTDNAAATSTMLLEREGIGRRERVVGMTLLVNI
jgi:hypothetical protein